MMATTLPLSYNVRNLRVRWQTAALSVLGIALVVAVFAVLAAMATGFRLTLRASGRPDNALVTDRGSVSELTSFIPRAQVGRLVVDARVARGSDGQPLASPEVVVVASMPRRRDGEPSNVTIRGVTSRAFAVRGGLRVTQGRLFTPGLYEVVVGERIHERIRGLDLGDKVDMQGRSWDVVGIFASEGSAFESEIWADADAVGPAFQRATGYQSLVLRMADPEALTSFADELRRNPEMRLRMKEERRYYEDQAGPVAASLLALAGFVSLVMGAGAVLAVMNTMHGVVSARSREIATLRALGFSRRSILLSFVLEAVCLAAVGGALGCLLALPVNGLGAATGSVLFSELAFAFRVTPQILGAASTLALVMGVAGGLLPALRASRLPIASALRGA